MITLQGARRKSARARTPGRESAVAFPDLHAGPCNSRQSVTGQFEVQGAHAQQPQKVPSGCMFSMEALEFAARARQSGMVPNVSAEPTLLSRPQSGGSRRGSRSGRAIGRVEVEVELDDQMRGLSAPPPKNSSAKPSPSTSSPASRASSRRGSKNLAADQENQELNSRQDSKTSPKSRRLSQASNVGRRDSKPQNEATSELASVKGPRRPSLSSGSPSKSSGPAVDETVDITDDSNREPPDLVDASSRRSRLSMVLQTVHMHSSKDNRMDRIKRMSLKAKADSALQARHKEDFAKLAENERQRLAEAFTKNAHKESNTIDAVPEVLSALAELGMKPMGTIEDQDIRATINQFLEAHALEFYVFALELVPVVRQRLTELQALSLREKFKEFDDDGNGQLDESECRTILQKLVGMNMDRQGFLQLDKEFKEIFRSCRTRGAHWVDFDNFDNFMQKLVEAVNRIRIEREKDIASKQALISSVVKRHKDELLLLHDSFQRTDLDGSGTLSHEEAQDIIHMHGLSMEFDTDELDEMFSNYSQDGVLTFCGFLNLINRLRAVIQGKSVETLRDLFDNYDKDRSGQLNSKEMSCVLEDLDLTPTTAEDQEAIKTLLQEIDVDRNGSYSFQEYLSLVRKINEKQRSLQIHREQKVALHLGFSDAQVKELRTIFVMLDEDGDHFLEFDELHKSIKLIKLPLNTDKLRELIRTLSSVDSLGKLDFPAFLKFARKVEMPLASA